MSTIRRNTAICLLSVLITIFILIPNTSFACACGCGVFDVGTSAMLPTEAGGMVFLEYDYMNQNKNWSGTSSAPAANNDDKKITSSFMTAGVKYMFNREWGVMAEVPYWKRHFVTDDGGIESFNHSALGDVRIRGIYSGFSPDMSSGVTFGLKLPTGDYSYQGFDRDTAIGTGSTDILLGAYHMGELTKDHLWNWFANAQLGKPVLTIGGYRPGSEVNLATGAYYNGWTFGKVKVAPVAQVIGSHRWRDGGVDGHPDDSGYDRVLLSPGLEVNVNSMKFYADVAVPVYQDVNGNQLVAPVLFKLNISRSF